MNRPLISVVIPNYNQSNLISRAIDSVLSQTYKNIEIVIVDDNSIDESKEILKKYKNKYPSRITLHFQDKNVGISKNKSFGLRIAKGEFITYLDGDDFYYPNKLEKEYEALQSKQCDIIYSLFNYVSNNNQVNAKWNFERVIPPEGFILKEVYSRNFPQNTLYRCELAHRSVWKEINYLDEKRKAFEDWDSRIKMSALFKIGFVDNVGCAYVDNPDSINHKENKIFFIKEFYAVCNSNLALLNRLGKAEKVSVINKLNRDISNKIDAIKSNFLAKIFLKLKYRLRD